MKNLKANRLDIYENKGTTNVAFEEAVCVWNDLSLIQRALIIKGTKNSDIEIIRNIYMKYFDYGINKDFDLSNIFDY